MKTNIDATIIYTTAGLNTKQRADTRKLGFNTNSEKLKWMKSIKKSEGIKIWR